jgi:RNA polymerase sigma factor (sigma-70 family)
MISLFSRKMDILDMYKSDISQYPLLSREEEQDLARKYRDPTLDSSIRFQSRQKLITSHTRWVLKVAGEYLSHLRIPISDKVGAGTIGFIKAVERFDPDRNIRLTTFSKNLIRQAIQKECIKKEFDIRTPDYMLDLMIQVRRYGEEVYRNTGVAASDRELLECVMAESESKLTETGIGLLHRIKFLELLERVPEYPERSTSNGGYRTIEREELSMLVREASLGLSEREWYVLHECITTKKSQKAIGLEIGITKSAVGQIRDRALKKMNKAISRSLPDLVAELV